MGNGDTFNLEEQCSLLLYIFITTGNRMIISASTDFFFRKRSFNFNHATLCTFYEPFITFFNGRRPLCTQAHWFHPWRAFCTRIHMVHKATTTVTLLSESLKGGINRQTDGRAERDHGRARAGRGLSCRTDFGIQIKHMLTDFRLHTYMILE